MELTANINDTISYVRTLRDSDELKEYKKNYNYTTCPITKNIVVFETRYEYWTYDEKYFLITVVDDYVNCYRFVKIYDSSVKDTFTLYQYKVIPIDFFDNHYQLISVTTENMVVE